jgi:hypothetical protein
MKRSIQNLGASLHERQRQFSELLPRVQVVNKNKQSSVPFPPPYSSIHMQTRACTHLISHTYTFPTYITFPNQEYSIKLTAGCERLPLVVHLIVDYQYVECQTKVTGSNLIQTKK